MMRITFLLFLQFLIVTAVNGATYSEIEKAVRHDDFTRIRAMIAEDGGAKGETAALSMLAAAVAGNQSFIGKLIDTEGIAVDAVPTRGNAAAETALLLAASVRQEGMVSFLLGRGAKANHIGICDSTCKGHTPILAAVRGGSANIVRMLLDAGADANVVNGCAVEAANKSGDVEIFQLLTHHGGRLPSDSISTNTKSGTTTSSAVRTAKASGESLSAFGLSQLLSGPSAPVSLPVSKERCRIAIIADDANVAAADLLMSRIASESSLEVVERQELNRLFTEQQLTRQDAAAEANYSKVATLLRADALLLIHTRQMTGTAAVEARFIRVHPGVVLDTVYRTAPLENVTSWAEQMSRRIPALAGKAIRKDAIALSVREVRASLPSPFTRGTERTLTVLLRDRLVHDPRFIVLERAEMEKTAFENAGEKPFWTGNYIVDPSVEFALDNSGNFVLSIAFQPLPNGKPVTVTEFGNRTNAAQVIDRLLEKLPAQLSAAPASPTTVVKTSVRRDADTAEAKNYLEESKWALAARMPARAHAAAEAAWALGLQTSEVARLRVLGAIRAARDECTQAMSPDSPPASEWLEFAIQAAALWKDGLENNLLPKGSEELRSWLELAPELSDGITLAMIAVDTATERVAQSDRLETLRQIFWAGLRQAWNRTAEFRTASPLPGIISKIQVGNVRLTVSHPNDIAGALREILARHFVVDDLATRTAIRLDFRWNFARLIDRSGQFGRLSNVGGMYLPHHETAKRQVVAEWQKSNAPEDRFFAALIEADSEFNDIALSVNRGTALMESFWGMRDFLAAHSEVFELYYDRYHSLMGNYPIVQGRAKPASYEVKLAVEGEPEKQTSEITDPEFRRRLYLYLRSHAARSASVFQKLLMPHFYTPEQLAEVQGPNGNPSVQTPGSTPNVNPTVSRPRPAIQMVQATPRADAPHLRITQLWNPFELNLNVSPEFRLAITTMLWQEDRLWVYGSVENPLAEPPISKGYVFAVDPVTMKTETFEFSGAAVQQDGDAILSITSTHILLTCPKKYVAVCDRATRKWDVYPEIKASHLGNSMNSAPVLIGDSAYMIVDEGNAFIRFDLKRRTSDILASTSRKPAQSPLDDATLKLIRVWKNDAGEMVVVGATAADSWQGPAYMHALSVEKKQWRLVQPPQPRRATALPDSGLANLPVVGSLPRASGDFKLGILRLRDPSAPMKEIVTELAPSTRPHLPENRFGTQPVRISNSICLRCPAGYIFPPDFGAIFWFVPTKDFDDFVSLNATTTAAH
ncbi:MAG: hypothetical protein JWM68_2813 [Verrucomicrobiales bacterium]|nr:hypothetical protein [Verrucomicrobiales bacterium]